MLAIHLKTAGSEVHVDMHSDSCGVLYPAAAIRQHMVALFFKVDLYANV